MAERKARQKNGDTSRRGTLAAGFSKTAFRMLAVLKTLFRRPETTMEELNHEIHHELGRLDGTPPSTYLHPETLTKYINTLRTLGCDIPRANKANRFRFRLEESPFEITPSPEDAKALDALMQMPVLPGLIAAKPAFNAFFDELGWYLPLSHRKQLRQQISQLPGKLEDGDRAILHRYQQMCDEGFSIQLELEPGQLPEQAHGRDTLVVDPVSLCRQGNRYVLEAIDQSSLMTMRLPLEAIRHAEQLPRKVRRQQGALTTVKLRFTGRLVHNYRLYPGERIISRRPRALVVQSQTTDVDALFRRVLRYQQHCEILSPDSLRDQMAAHIQKLLSLLETGPTPR